MAFIKRNILFVDDDPMAQAMIQSMLSQAGYTVTCVDDGFAAIDLLHQHAFDILLLDIMMDKMNGLELLKRLKAQPETKDVPIMMMSARDDKQVVARAIQLGANDYVVKPPQRDLFLKKIENLLGGRPRFSEVYMNEASEKAKAEARFQCRIASIGESGLSFLSPIPFQVGSLQELHFPVLKDLGVMTTRFKIVHCQADKDAYSIYVNYLTLKANEVRSIREWVVLQALKGRTVA